MDGRGIPQPERGWEMLTKLKPCRVCKQMKPESAFAWTLDKNGVRKRTQRCAKCWSEQMEKEARLNMEWHREKRGTVLEFGRPAVARSVWGDSWPTSPEIMNSRYWTATDTRKADAEWALKFRESAK